MLRKLRIMDKSRLTSGGSSDPLVPFRWTVNHVTYDEEKSEARLWVEYFELPIEDEQQTLQLKMEDYEQFSANQCAKVFVPWTCLC